MSHPGEEALAERIAAMLEGKSARAAAGALLTNLAAVLVMGHGPEGLPASLAGAEAELRRRTALIGLSAAEPAGRA
jgi:anthranilate phosphoribosyltransferase